MVSKSNHDSVLFPDDRSLRHVRMTHENVTHMSGTSVTYAPGLNTHQGAGNFIHGCWCV